MPRKRILLLSLIFFILFVGFSYIVAKEKLVHIDFDTTVKVQDRIPRKFDKYFSILSFLGSAEVTFTIALIITVTSFFKKKFSAGLAWILILPATLVTVLGKLFIFHPSPPNFLLRTVDLNNDLPRFYIHTDYSYPSGHVTRTLFLMTALIVIVLFSSKQLSFKIVSIVCFIFYGFLMALSRVYLGEHWFSDVVGGAFLGISSGLFATLFMIGKFKFTKR